VRYVSQAGDLAAGAIREFLRLQSAGGQIYLDWLRRSLAPA